MDEYAVIHITDGEFRDEDDVTHGRLRPPMVCSAAASRLEDGVTPTATTVIMTPRQKSGANAATVASHNLQP
jgi:hypothetical protein